MKRVLLITDNAREACAAQDSLSASRHGSFDVACVTTLLAGLESLVPASVDVILVSLSLPDGAELLCLDRLIDAAPHTPILTISVTADEELEAETIRRGGCACIAPSELSTGLLARLLRDIIQQRLQNKINLTETARAGVVLNAIGDAVISTDMLGRIDYMNTAAEDMTGWQREDAKGQPVDQVMHIVNGITRNREETPIALVLRSGLAASLAPDAFLIRRDGSEIPIEDSASPITDWSGQIIGAVLVFRDVSAAQAMARKMTYLAQYDFLTDLPNRVLLNDRIAQAIKTSQRNQGTIAVLFLDLDGFKHINDSLGHESGDLFLQSVARRLTNAVRRSDTVSRRGGDEFLILLTEIHDAENAAAIADKIIASLKLPHLIRGSEAYVTASIGISVCPADGLDAEKLIKSADAAMYYAKANGGDRHHFFGREMNVRSVERHFIEGHLRQALDRNEFVLYYQPIVNLDTGRITGAEALLRWQSSERGLVFPPDFIGIAEETGLIVPIGQWVLREACTQARRWSNVGLPSMSIAVNISAVEFRRRDFLDGVRHIIEGTGIDPSVLQLEITESVLMQDVRAVAAILRQLKLLGVRIALDDFGTGYSSLSYLNQFPIDILKIDRSFVQDINAGSENGVIVSAVVGMGNSLRKAIIAEGIENVVQLQFLKRFNCAEGQGYLFSHPVPAETFANLLANGLPKHADC